MIALGGLRIARAFSLPVLFSMYSPRPRLGSAHASL
jgi:hypothetical protein